MSKLLPSIRRVKDVWKTYRKCLDGVFCIYKPTEMTTGAAKAILRTKIINNLNKLPLHIPPREVIAGGFDVQETREASQTETGETSVVPTSQSLMERWTEHTLTEQKAEALKFKLVFGELFMKNDISLQCLCPLHFHSSGVLVFGTGSHGLQDLKMINEAKYLRVYHVKGRFGYATDNFFTSGKFIERSTYHHITSGKLDKVCSAAQSGHQRLMFEYARVNPDSQEAYELACQGIIRPATTDTPPMLYGVKCIYFNPPDFTLEIHAINEHCEYMAELVNDIGLKLKSNAVCTHIHRIRHGYFTLDDTLLHKDWDLQSIVRNINHCEQHVTPEKLFTNLMVDKTDSEKSYDEDEIEDDDENWEPHQLPSAVQLARKYSKHRPVTNVRPKYSKHRSVTNIGSDYSKHRHRPMTNDGNKQQVDR